MLFLVVTTLLPLRSIGAGNWLHLGSSAPDSVGMTMLLSDGTVIANNYPTDVFGNAGADWYRLTPDPQGHYVNGEWTRIASSFWKRAAFGSAMLTNGNILVVGGEHPDNTPTQTSAEIYNTLANTWTLVTPPLSLLDSTQSSPDFSNFVAQGFSDCETKILPNGNVLVAPAAPNTNRGTLLFNVPANTWSVGPQALYPQAEETWLKLPDGSILTVNHDTNSSQRYIPALNQWINDASVPVNLWANLQPKFSGETGPAFLLPNGTAFFLGGTGKTAIYTPSGGTNSGTWIAGPDIPQGLVCADSPGAMMPNGKILFSAAPPPNLDGNNNLNFPTPTSFFEYDYRVGAVGSYTQVPSPTDGTDDIPSFQASMLVLPDGSILYNHWKGGDAFYSSFGNQLHVYVPDGTPVAVGKPIIESITPNGDGTFHLVGYNLNGISEGACYGDDVQPHSNYPIIQFKDTNNAHVDYGRTFNWTGTGVYTGTSSTEFSLPPGLIPQTYLVQVSANGILSDPVVFSFVNPSSLALCPGESGTLSGFASPQPTSYQWLFNGFAIPGETSLQLQLNNVTTNQSGYYTLRATTSGWPVDSLPVPVSVGEWVVSQPPVTNSATICGPTTLTVSARGKGILSPQWLFNGKPIVLDARITNATTSLANGSTQFQLQISDVHYTDDGFYSVAIKDDCGTNVTSAFALRVTPNPAWVLTATTGPPSRYKAAGCYDSTRHVTVLFGGMDPNGIFFGDTWEYDGTNWLQRFPTNAPQERAIAQMVYDPFRQKCILFGGQIVSNNTYVMSHETWEYDGVNWQKIVTANTPTNWTIADNFAGCFDTAHGREMLIYGGTAPVGKLNEFWGYDGTDWVQKHPGGPTPAVPNTPFMAFDSARSVAVLFGAVPTNNPYAFQEVWEWDGTNWANKPVSGQQFGGVLIYDNLTYDTVRHECILYGAIPGNVDGVDSINLPYPDGYRYIWRWNGQQWQADPATPTPGIKDFQLYATFCFDSYRNAAVIYGGSGNSTALTNLTFELAYADTPISLQQTTTQIALLGQTVQLSVLTAGARPITYRWMKGIQPLSDGVNISGSNSNLLTLHVTTPSDAGTYKLNMVNTCGAASSQPITLNVVAGQLVIGVSSGHPAITWGNAAATLQSAASVTGPWSTINGATSPYQVNSPAGTVFYRLIQ